MVRHGPAGCQPGESAEEQAERHELASEVVLVDWNPPIDRPTLRDALSWPDRQGICELRMIEVSPSVHGSLSFSDSLPFLAHTAWNTGIRRARGKFVLCVTNDVLLSDALFRFLADGRLDDRTLYRVDRYDVPEEVLTLGSLDDRLAFSRENVRHVNGHDGAMAIPGHDVRLHTNAAGDFLLLSRDFWHKLRGLPQEHEFHSNKLDALLCYMAYAGGARQEVLEAPMRVYHVSHELSDWKTADRWPVRFGRRLRFLPALAPGLGQLVRRVVRPTSRVGTLGVPQLGKAEYQRMVSDILEGKRSYVYNDENWGLGDLELPEAKPSTAGGRSSVTDRGGA